MNTLNELTIKLASFLSTSHLSLRHTADALFDEIERYDAKKVVFDFNEVHIMSRSFAHQYLMRKKQTHKQISETNVQADVKSMLKAVASTKARKIDNQMHNIRVASLAEVNVSA